MKFRILPVAQEDAARMAVDLELRVIYAIWNEEVVLLAVIHVRQKPARWRHRLTELD